MGRAALPALVALLGALALYASALALLAWADDLDDAARARLYPAPRMSLAPIERCQPGRATWGCLP